VLGSRLVCVGTDAVKERQTGIREERVRVVAMGCGLGKPVPVLYPQRLDKDRMEEV
jgi:hypothetical protein